MHKWIVFGLLSCWLTAGCEKRTLDEGKAAPAKTEAGNAAAKKKPRPKPVPRKTVEGNWVVEAGNRRNSSFSAVAVINVRRDPDGKLTVRLLDPHPQYPELRMVGYQAEPNMVAGSFLHPAKARNAPPTQMAFRVRNLAGEWRGLAQVGNDYVPTRLIGTTEDRIERYQQPVPFEHARKFQDAIRVLQAKSDLGPMNSLIKKYPGSPRSYFALTSGMDPFREILGRPPEEIAPAAIPLRKDLEEYLSLVDLVGPAWGSRTHMLLRLNFAARMQYLRVEPDLVDRIAREFDGGKFKSVRETIPQIELVRVAADFELDLANALESKDEARIAEAVKRLADRKQAHWRFQPMRLFALAEAGRKIGSINAALRNYAKLLVLPGLPGALGDDLKYRRKKPVDIRKRFDELWNSAGRPEVDKQAFLDETYRTTLFSILKDHPPDPGGYATSPVLIELFTGSEAPRCAAIDIALAANQRTFLPGDLVVLRYHFPVPKLSPLGSPASKAVSRRLGTGEPPDILFNGLPWELFINGQRRPVSLDGTMATYVPFYWQSSLHAREYNVSMTMLYNRLRTQIVGLMLRKNSGYDVNLKAAGHGDVLSIDANVTKPTDAKAEIRVRFALAEDHIVYTGANGVRRHEMVVRGVPGKIEGLTIDPKTGHVKTSINLKQLRDELRNYLEGLKKQGSDAKIDESLLDFRNLHLVGIVQDKDTNRVLAVKSIVVKGRASSLVDRHKFGAVYAPKPIDHRLFRAPPPPLPITPGKKTTTGKQSAPKKN